MDERIYWIWLSRMKGIGIKKLKLLLSEHGSLEELWKLNKNKLKKTKNIGEKTVSELLNDNYKKNLDKYLEYMIRNKIDIISFKDSRYPKQLGQIYDPPFSLYIKGNSDILKNNMVAIVGSRNCSNYGKKVSTELANYLSKRNITVVSGLARGIDTYAHIGAMNGQGKTIAVLGSGFIKLYPKENIKIARDILEKGGTIISEYPLEKEPNRLNFPARNRIISGLSNKIVVVEARKNSGSLITVDYALEQGKDVFVVPGNITSNLSKSTNELIQEGANVITKYEDIMKFE